MSTKVIATQLMFEKTTRNNKETTTRTITTTTTKHNKSESERRGGVSHPKSVPVCRYLICSLANSRWQETFEGVFPYMQYIGMRGPKEHGFISVLVSLLSSRVCFLHSSLFRGSYFFVIIYYEHQQKPFTMPLTSVWIRTSKTGALNFWSGHK